MWVFDQLYGSDVVDLGTPVFWSTPGAREITDFAWDTDVVQVTQPWPTIEPQTVREALAMIIGHNEVTGFLFTHQDMIDFEASQTAAKGWATPCKNCGQFCGDKWCGLRGDDETRIIDGQVRTGEPDPGPAGPGGSEDSDRPRTEESGGGVHSLQVPLAGDGREVSGAVEGGADLADAERLGSQDQGK